MKGLRTKKVNTIKEGTLIVAVDIGMVSNHGCCTTADGRKDGKICTRPSQVFALNHSHYYSACRGHLYLQMKWKEEEINFQHFSPHSKLHFKMF